MIVPSGNREKPNRSLLLRAQNGSGLILPRDSAVRTARPREATDNLGHACNNIHQRLYHFRASTGRRFRFIREAGPARQASRILNRRLSRHHVLFVKLHDQRLAAVQLPGLDVGDDKDVDRGIGLLHRQRPEVTKFEAEFFRKFRIRSTSTK
jgi:hypothetical protein